jgi:hypothetical protein
MLSFIAMSTRRTSITVLLNQTYQKAASERSETIAAPPHKFVQNTFACGTSNNPMRFETNFTISPSRDKALRKIALVTETSGNSSNVVTFD